MNHYRMGIPKRGIPLSWAARLQLEAVTRHPVSLSAEVMASSDGGVPLLVEDCLESDEPSPEECARVDERDAQIHAALETLTPKQQAVVALVLGLGPHHAHTFEEAALLLGVSRQAIHNTYTRAIHQLKTRLKPLASER